MSFSSWRGEGRVRAHRRRALEARRIPAIVRHPEFKKDPWATIRVHAGNSVAAKEVTAPEPGLSARRIKADAMVGVE